MAADRHLSDACLLCRFTVSVEDEDGEGKHVAGEETVVFDKDDKEVVKRKTNANGVVSEELLEYKGATSAKDEKPSTEKTYGAPYAVKVRVLKQRVSLGKNTELTLRDGE